MTAGFDGGLPGVCFVTDRHAAGDRPILEVATAAIQGGASLLQVREKDLSAKDLLRLVLDLRAAAHAIGSERVRIVVNDRLDVAVAAKAAGVHLPSTGLPVAAVRQKVGRKFLIGRSVHGLAEAREAEKAGADYLVFGPVFATPSKIGLGEPQGAATLAKLVQAVRVPVWAIGGIQPENAALLRGTGIAGVAAITAIAAAPDPAAAVRALRAALGAPGTHS
jgi:thiamine-phosphate pyrophosphorylase